MSGLTHEGCLGRQRRLCNRLSAEGLDAAVITDTRDIYYFTGALFTIWPAFLLVMANGRTLLVAQESADAPLADEYITYQPHTNFTNNPDNMRRLNQLVEQQLAGFSHITKIGWQAESMPHLLMNTVDRLLALDRWVPIDDDLAVMQSRKDVDEVELIRRSIRANIAGYNAAQAVIAPGVNELEVLSTAQRAASLDAGESVYHGGDFRSGQLGGPARDRRIEAGELYIVDAQTVYRGYWCDMSRAYCVNSQPTDLQKSIHAHIAAIQNEVQALLKPGLCGTELARILDKRLREHPALAQAAPFHHAGHGVGLRAHEAPDLNREREGILEPGNVVSVEPGGYTEALRNGVRLENMYLITATGADLLSDYPMNLIPRGDA